MTTSTSTEGMQPPPGPLDDGDQAYLVTQIAGDIITAYGRTGRTVALHVASAAAEIVVAAIEATGRGG